jgi:hypothetical protein
VPLAIAAFGVTELINPEFLSTAHHISTDLAQMLLGAGVGTFGLNIYTGRSRGARG